jgi:hypothetical protein
MKTFTTKSITSRYTGNRVAIMPFYTDANNLWSISEHLNKYLENLGEVRKVDMKKVTDNLVLLTVYYTEDLKLSLVRKLTR